MKVEEEPCENCWRIFEIEVDSHQLEAFEGGLGGIFEHLKKYVGVFAGIFAAHELKEFFEATIEQAAHLQDLSEKLGVGTDELQKFQFAAKLAGVDSEGAAGAIGKLNRAIGQAIGGSKEAKEKFEKLGIELKEKNGDLRGAGEVILDLADKMKELKSAPEKTALAMKFFGRSGAALVPMLQEGTNRLWCGCTLNV